MNISTTDTSAMKNATMKNIACLITGATNGIGKATAIELAARGATIAFTARNKELGEATKQEIISRTGNTSVEMLFCDLSSFISIIQCCNDVKARYSALHVLVNNAGVWENQRRLSRDGVEMTFAVNHLAPFLMTNLLLDLLQSSATVHAPSRIVTVSSEAHRSATMNFDDLEGKASFSSLKAYAQSKLANILFTRQLARRLDAAVVTANCLHPGVVSTNLFKNFPSIVQRLIGMFMLSPEKGAATSVYLASAPAVQTVSGKYFKNKKIVQPSKYACDDVSAERLWEISRQYVNL
jgi:NAD(P)-dependent dehydrogenase (short-subunit alcohol dehydrogenase family)